jgi:hypothetical protein
MLLWLSGSRLRLCTPVAIEPLVADAGEQQDHGVARRNRTHRRFRRCSRQAVLYANNFCHARLQKLVETDELPYFTLPVLRAGAFLKLSPDICAFLDCSFFMPFVESGSPLIEVISSCPIEPYDS